MLVTCNCGREYNYVSKNRQGHTRTKCNSCSVNTRRKGVKDRCIEYKGGACSVCGYNKCKRALSFHHLDPSKKDFGVNKANAARSWDSLKNELDKCILLCANCHMELHEGLIQAPIAGRSSTPLIRAS